MSINRRSFLAAAAAGITLRGLPAMAATAPVSFKHGAFEVTVVSDGHLVLPTAMLALNAPQAERDTVFKDMGYTGERYDTATNVTLIRTPNDLILVDMGSGDRFMPSAGKLWDNLKAAGIDKSKITKVIFTHGHPDHLWGAVDELDELELPQAAYYAPAAEWDFWASADALRGLPEERAGTVTGARRNFAAIKDRVTLFKPNTDIAGISIIDTAGHTQGHVCLALAGGDGLMILGDALTHPLISFEHPHWRPAADHVPDQAAQTRAKLLDRLAADRMKVVGFHFPYPGIGTVERKGSAYRFVPA